jgi:hypothetical protein
MWLSTRNIQIDRSSRKLDHKMIKFFKILKKRDSSYKLDLSKKMNIHSVFHISLLRKDSQNLMLDQVISSSSSIIIENEKKYDVKNIVDSHLINRTFNKRFQYKIRWIEHSSNRKWYSVENFDHAKRKLWAIIIKDILTNQNHNLSTYNFWSSRWCLISIIHTAELDRAYARQRAWFKKY